MFALVKMSDYLEQVSIDNSDQIAELESKISKLEARLNNLGSLPVVSTTSVEEVKVVEKRNTEFNYIEVGLIENVLNNGNIGKKKVDINKINEIKTAKKEKLIASNLENATVVACSEDEFVIMLPQVFNCDFMMQKTTKEKVLKLINSEEQLVNNYYAIPEDVWNMILADYTQQFKAGIKKPQLAHINIDVRLYNEVEVANESEMEKLAHEFFGENVSFE